MEGLLGVVDDVANAILDSGLSIVSLVTTVGKDLSVVGGATTVPGQKLRES